jgi:hypothetical protein
MVLIIIVLAVWYVCLLNQPFIAPHIVTGLTMDVRLYGAGTGDDDTLAIKTALYESGGNIYLPKGEYIIGETL